MNNFWKAEPTMILAVLNSGIALLITFGVHLTVEQAGAIMAFSSTVLGLVTRSQVTSPKVSDDMKTELAILKGTGDGK